ARPSSDGGMVSPRARAVLRLMSRSNLIGCSTGRMAPRWRLRRAHGGTRAVSSLEQLVGASEHRAGDRQPKGLRRLEVDHKVELGWLFHGQVGRLGALEDLLHVAGGAAEEL